jgi:hypothetical protein
MGLTARIGAVARQGALDALVTGLPRRRRPRRGHAFPPVPLAGKRLFARVAFVDVPGEQVTAGRESLMIQNDTGATERTSWQTGRHSTGIYTVYHPYLQDNIVSFRSTMKTTINRDRHRR